MAIHRVTSSASAPLPAASNSAGSPGQGYVVSVGDSIAFGLNPNLPDANPDAFVAFGNDVARDEGWQLANFAQPGESTSSALDKNARNNGGWKTDSKTGKRVHDRPLHEEYNNDQVDSACDFLRAHPDTHLVTLTLGGNDLLLLGKDAQKSRLPEAVYGLAKLPQVAAKLYRNDHEILQKIRKVYSGPIVVTTDYAMNYTDPLMRAALEVENHQLERLVKAENKKDAPVRLADIYGAFEKETAAHPDAKGSAGKAGLLLPYKNDFDIHPTARGHAIIAHAVEQADPDLAIKD